MRAPDLVGAAEAAEILGVEVPRITRYRKAGKMPLVAVEGLAAGPVWFRSDVEAMRDERKVTARAPLDLLGTSEVAALLAVDKSQIGRWRRAGRFPSPLVEVRSGPLWARDVITAFRKPTRGRAPAVAD